MEQKVRDGKSIPGTPLWMAPEVLLGKDVDEKADVYSYGIVLWEIIAEQEPFPHMDSYGTFKRCITAENERPPIPVNVHPNLKALMEVCWDVDPRRRPTFQQILPIIDSVLVDVILDDPEANRFWKTYFLGKVNHCISNNIE
jgi:serine/threonine protein kinase